MVENQNQTDPSVIAISSEPIEGITFKGFSDEVVTRVAAVLATNPLIDRYELADETGIHHQRIGLLSRQLVKNGLVSVEPVKSPIGGPPRRALATTEKFDSYLAQRPDWQRATEIRKLAKSLGKTEEEAIDFLLSLGDSAVADKETIQS
ncbi:MAG TPA: hypothetical protein VLF87_03000 [Patescibacteria group bacterium]|nr:hypothetical protein [Patescibacteria group bacterium]